MTCKEIVVNAFVAVAQFRHNLNDIKDGLIRYLTLLLTWIVMKLTITRAGLNEAPISSAMVG